MAFLTAARGLVVFRNELANVEGALAVADNVNIDEPDVITPRRGYNDFGNSVGNEDTRIKQVMQYKGRILRHFKNTLQFENAIGSFENFTGSFIELEEGIRIKYQEANGNLYFTTSSGVKKLSLRSVDQYGQYDITDAGAVAAVDCEAKLVPAVGGFMPPQSKVAYRIVFGYKDRNNNLFTFQDCIDEFEVYKESNKNYFK